ncbi:MAG: ABC transporter permease [Thaumarchaeota archaeon]|nr:ABC transporter permease [Nitrososphaerota archaeon]
MRSSQSGGNTRIRSTIAYLFGLIVRNPLVLIGSVIVFTTIILAVFSYFLVNPSIWKIENISSRLCWNNPWLSWQIPNVLSCTGSNIHLLGTDLYGRDLLTMILLALPTDLSIAFAVVLAAFAIGVTLGSIAAYAGGKTDEAILRVTDVFFATPPLVLALVIVAILGRNLSNLAIAILIVWWPTYVRLTRAQVLSEKEKNYVEALVSLGASRTRVLVRHVIPNSVYPVLVQVTFDLSRVILILSTLMFLGFSPSPLLPELGNLVSEGINYVNTAPWLIIFPGLTILIIVFGFNLFGDGIRDIMDPRVRR